MTKKQSAISRRLDKLQTSELSLTSGSILSKIEELDKAVSTRLNNVESLTTLHTSQIVNLNTEVFPEPDYRPMQIECTESVINIDQINNLLNGNPGILDPQPNPGQSELPTANPGTYGYWITYTISNCYIDGLISYGEPATLITGSGSCTIPVIFVSSDETNSTTTFRIYYSSLSGDCSGNDTGLVLVSNSVDADHGTNRCCQDIDGGWALSGGGTLDAGDCNPVLAAPIISGGYA